MLSYGSGDDGYTRIVGGERVPKHDPRLDALGNVDEATSAVGVARSLATDARTVETLRRLQRDLYLVMADLATPPGRSTPNRWRIGEAEAEWLDEAVTEVGQRISRPNGFVLPGATRSSAALDLARAILRRAERGAAGLAHGGAVENLYLLRYLNRASALVFLLARAEDEAQGANPDLASF
jgi:cob(I)alamin adenosyltransferase